MEKNINDLLKELNDLHDKIKENKYRENSEIYSKYALGYYDTLHKLVDKFVEIKNTKQFEQLNSLIDGLFIHDFSSAITMSRSSAYWLLNENNPNIPKELFDRVSDKKIIEEKSLEIEYGLICIHSFIKTYRLDTLYNWSRGVYMRYVWNEDKKEYEPIQIIKEREKGNKQYILKNNIFPTLQD